MRKQKIYIGMSLYQRKHRGNDIAQRRAVNMIFVKDGSHDRAVILGKIRNVFRHDFQRAARLLRRKLKQRNAEADLARRARRGKRIGHAL